MPRKPTQTPNYWVDQFRLEPADIEHISQVLLESETPLSAEELALIVMRYRVQQDVGSGPRKIEGARLYRPSESYKVGETLHLSAFDGAGGKVLSVRSGQNPEVGSFDVITVELDRGGQLDLAAGLSAEHALNNVEPEDDEDAEAVDRSPEELFIDFGGYIADVLEESLTEYPELVKLAGRYFPKALLAEVNVGQLHLAEALLDMSGGGPMAANDLIEELGISLEANPRLAEFSLNYALEKDERFDEVGPAGQVLWYLKRMEPEEVQTPPSILVYQTVNYDPERLPSELADLEHEIGDEHSRLPCPRERRPDSVTLTLIHPHVQAGTLPLTPQLRRMFPTAYEAPRVRFTLVDAASGEEIPAWVVRSHGYVYGLAGWFVERAVPIGAYLSVSRTGEAGKVAVQLAQRKNPRMEWVLQCSVNEHHIGFETVNQRIGYDYDETMLITVADPAALASLAAYHAQRKTTIDRLVEEILRGLAAGTPNGNVHARTLYSAVNLLRRCPPGPIFAALAGSPQIEHSAGPYWRLRQQD